MYANIQFQYLNDTKDVLRDYVSILTGETDINNLVSDIFEEESFISVASTVAGWTLWDDQITASGYAVLRAPIVDDPTEYKYAWLNVTGKAIALELHDSWDEVGHTGVKVERRHVYETRSSYATDLPTVQVSGAPSSYAFNTSTPESIGMISASERHMSFNSVYGSGFSSSSGICGIFEHTRDTSWDKPGKGWKPVCITYGNLSASNVNNGYYTRWFCKFKTPRIDATKGEWVANAANGNDKDTMSKTCMFLKTGCGNTEFGDVSWPDWNPLVHPVTSYINRKYTEADLTSHSASQVMIPFGLQNMMLADNAGGIISDMADIYMLYNDIGSQNDIVLINDVRYRLWGVKGGRVGSYDRFVIREG